MGPKLSLESNKKFKVHFPICEFIDSGDFQECKYTPTNQQTSLETRKQLYAKSYEGPVNGEVGEFTGLQQFFVPEKYTNYMKERTPMLKVDPLKCQKPNIQGNSGIDPYMFKKSINVYFGEWNKAKPHGYGKIVNPDQDYYFQGYFQDGLPSYYGVFLAENIQYEGQFKYGMAWGQGKYVEGSKTIKGQFKENYPSRNCIQNTQTYTFIGDYEKNAWSNGKLTWNNQKCTYEGQFQGGLMDGKGTLKIPQYVYQGSFRQGRKHGKGKINWQSGEFYEGQFSDDQITGKGKLYKQNKLVYQGSFVKGLSSGQGWALENQKLIHSKWNDGTVTSIL